MPALCIERLFTIVLLIFLYRKIDSALGDDFCLDQEDAFQDCSSRMEFIYLARSQSLDILCKEIAQYLSCVHETNVSCPDMPIFQDRVYTDAVQNAMNQLTRFCKGYSISTKCTERFVNHLVSKCTTILNKVQVDTSREDMCEYSKEYLGCLQRATDVCHNNTEFLILNVPLAMASTESALRAVCDDVQEDNPDSHVTGANVTAHPMCSRETVRSEADKCIRHTEHPSQIMDAVGCSAYKCPKEIEVQDEDVVSYCMKDFYDVEPSAVNYCKKLQLVPECIEDVSALCPPSQRPFKLDGALELINNVIVSNCKRLEVHLKCELSVQLSVSPCMKMQVELKLGHKIMYRWIEMKEIGLYPGQIPILAE